jgi:hypothetical protein
MDRFATCHVIMRAPRRLAVDGDEFPVDQLVHSLYPLLQAIREHSSEN